MVKQIVHQGSSWTEDEKLAMEFLTGRRTRENGRETHRYLKPGGDDELKARAAFIRLLSQSDLNKSVRHSLGGLFNPFAGGVESRELVFRQRSRGKRSDGVRDIRLAMDVVSKADAGTKLEAAIREVMIVYGVKRATAFKAWKEHGKTRLADLQARKVITQSKEKPVLISGLGVPYPYTEV
jgi:hypothetical protein